VTRAAHRRAPGATPTKPVALSSSPMIPVTLLRRPKDGVSELCEIGVVLGEGGPKPGPWQLLNFDRRTRAGKSCGGVGPRVVAAPGPTLDKSRAALHLRPVTHREEHLALHGR
jgi:hypothetical protein